MMQLQQRIDKWYSRLRKYLFTYRNGFFEFSYPANSPDMFIGMFTRLPFVKHDAAAQTVYSRNPFNEGVMHYQHINNDVVLFLSDVRFRANASIRFQYDKYLPVEYYYLSFLVNQQQVPAKGLMIDGQTYTNKSWWLFRPGYSANSVFFKGANELLVTLVFREAWLQKMLEAAEPQQVKELNLFLKSEQGYLIWPCLDNSQTYVHESICQTVRTKGPKGVYDLPLLEKQAEELFFAFARTLQEQNVNATHFAIDNAERVKIVKAEHLLMKQLCGSFPGIETIADEAGMSQTKLKELFKLVYGESPFQYFQSRQMSCARDLLQQPNRRVQDIAALFGYENASKFAAAFQKCTGLLPSEVQPGKTTA